MDDRLVLNIAIGDFGSSKPVNTKKGGRWTDRLKAKRVAKRKAPSQDKIASDKTHHADADTERRSTKRPRKDQTSTAPATTQSQLSTVSRPQAHIISSLFSSNPKVQAPLNNAARAPALQPSNAPLADSSTFLGLGLDPLIATHLSAKMDIGKPTSIQRSALPALIDSTPAKASRDIFIQSQTGSGKTLSFLLPILQDLLPLSTHSYIDRSIGTLAIIIAPTRELAKQISDVLEALLQLRLRPENEAADDPNSLSPRLTRWLVSGLLTGGATRTHEKARLRKGIPILVSTPGRLLDHLQNTSSFNVGKCRWLVLDEADRLMELGFEETITGIIQGLDGRRRLALQAVEEGKSVEVGGWDWKRRRRTVLCSATIREDVQKLAGAALVNPLMVKATESDTPTPVTLTTPGDGSVATPSAPEKFTPPSQLSQNYVVVPLKQRLVTLVALLRSLIGQSKGRRGTKIIVFLSCTDSVDFHWNLLAGSAMNGDQDVQDRDQNEDSDKSSDNEGFQTPPGGEKVEVKSSLFPDTSIFRLHGSLATSIRLASLRGFSTGVADKIKPAPLSSSSILLCTSVASRGLDLPLVRAVIQYDLPTEGGATEYVHRVGRTARAGKGGEAWSIVAPSEAEWIKWVEDKMRGDEKNTALEDAKKNIVLSGASVESILKAGFGGSGHEYEERATEVQLSFERWVLSRGENATLARKAYLSHMRAYATHPSNEKHIFHIKHLHIGHLAKAFALREAPKSVNAGHANLPSKGKSRTKPSTMGKERPKVHDPGWDVSHSGEAEKRMQEIVRSQGRLSKKGGIMVSSGTSEFQIAGGAALEKLVNGRS
ncbi:DEAD-domain-containing protein [Infundibulicybe gibba]|nr:DEAD-domain-containing protein [Infundibulicybe gibba]